MGDFSSEHASFDFTDSADAALDGPPSPDKRGRFSEGELALISRVTRYHFVYSLAGLVLGLAAVIGGIVLFLRGITGSTSWSANIIGAESEILDAAPGAVLFVVGLFVVWVTRFKFDVKRRIQRNERRP
ncbi:hypothetical protein ACFL9T_21655 [Thermodesulfobacteriota bacterium]